MRRYWPALLVVVLGLSVVACDTRPPLAFSPVNLPEAQAGQAYRATITVSGNQTPVGDISATPGSLPPGLAITHESDSSSATITGVPQTAGRYDFTISAWCLGTNQAGQTGHQDYTLVVKAP